MKKLVVSCVAGLALVVGLSSCGENVLPEKVGSTEIPSEVKSEVAAPTSYKIGDQVKLKDSVVTILATGEFKSTTSYIKPGDGMEFRYIEVLVENVGDEPVSYNTFHYKLVDNDAYSYEPSFSGKEPTLNSGTLQAGNKARGFITFEVPVGVGGLEVVYTPNFLNASEARIEL